MSTGTAGAVIDLRNDPAIGRALLFFHGTGPEGESVVCDQYACIGIPWSDDLKMAENNPENIGLVPESVPMVQGFGREPLWKNCDRITADDEKIVELAVTYLLRSDINRSAFFGRSDMVRCSQHPRIVHFPKRMNTAGIEVAEFVFGKYDTDFTKQLKAYIESGSEKSAFSDSIRTVEPSFAADSTV